PKFEAEPGLVLRVSPCDRELARRD
ncbi:hypothetical protein A2U01_0091044, partial [Trifolium medium]|nr:hypothetical protein [Trifolium medium]